MRRAIRRVVVGALERSGLLPFLRRRADLTRAMVLRYHSVSEPTAANDCYRCPSIATSPETFERQIRFLAERYRVVPLGLLVDHLAAGEPFPARAVALTFDDGYRDNYLYVLPILRALGLPATVFVTTDAIGDGWRFWVSRLRFVLLQSRTPWLEVPVLGPVPLRTRGDRLRTIDRLTLELKRLPPEPRDAHLERLVAAAGIAEPPPAAARWMMDWTELREMAAAGIEIGAHTRTHPVLTRVPAEEATVEIADSRRVLEEGLGRPVVHFAYPNGGGVSNHDARVAAMVREAGFRSAATSDRGPLRLGDDPFRLRRVGVSERHGLDGLALHLEGDRLLRVARRREVSRPTLLLVGPPEGALSGIATCVAGIRRSRVGERFRIDHVSPTGKRAHYELGRARKLGAAAGAAVAFFARFVRSRPSVVQVHVAHYGDFWRNAPFVLLASAFRAPIVLVLHGSRFDEFFRGAGRVRRSLIRFVLRRPAAILVRGRYWRDLVRAIVPGKRVELLPTTTDLVEPAPRERRGAPAELTVLFVGNPSPGDALRKGLDDLLAVVPDVLARVPGARFRLVGPRLETPWSEMLGAAAWAGHVEFTGPLPRERLTDQYRDAALFVLPSRAEGMPNAILEAMAHGLPVVATKVGSIPEVLEEGLGGKLVEPGDRRALGKALAALLEDPAAARAMGERNRARVRKEFGHEKTAERLIALYESILGPEVGRVRSEPP